MNTRRDFLRHVAATALGLAGVVAAPSFAFAAMSEPARRLAKGPHPTPRPGITAAKVLATDALKENPKAAPVFDMVRKIPEIVDGIRCQCGCAELPEFYSLLSCYEADGMAQHCVICQGEGRLAYTMHEQGKTLDEIRAAIDERFGQ
jgi:uncharacterized protein with PCYCGC motif